MGRGGTREHRAGVAGAVGGADGCPGGWICIAKNLETGELSWNLYPDAQTLIEQTPTPLVLAIDIPIGLMDSGGRECDQMARKLLRGRASCVFSAPIRPILDAKSWDDASALSRQINGKGISKQTWAICTRIRDIDGVLRRDASLREFVREVHPEVSFAEWNGGVPMPVRKQHADGKKLRSKLVDQYFGSDAFAMVRDHCPRKDAADDDILDAFAALWSAERIHRNEAMVVPSSPPSDSCRLPMAIWY